MKSKNNTIELEEIQDVFKVLTKEVISILHIEHHHTINADEFKKWTNRAKVKITALKEKYSNYQLLKFELNTEISKLKPLVDVLYKELLNEGTKPNGRIIGFKASASIFIDKQSFDNYTSALIKELEKNETYSIEDRKRKNIPVAVFEYIGALIKGYTGCYIGYWIYISYFI